MAVNEIGCCGAYCRTCRVFRASACKGCKQGYASGERDISKAKCAIKVCCIRHGNATCADCPDYAACVTIQAFHTHEGFKYGKYRQAIEYILTNGYDAFIRIADQWSNAYGRYDGEERRGSK